MTHSCSFRHCEASHNSFVIARRTKEFRNEKNVMLVLRHCEAHKKVLKMKRTLCAVAISPSPVIATRTKEFRNEKNVMLVYVIARRTKRLYK